MSDEIFTAPATSPSVAPTVVPDASASFVPETAAPVVPDIAEPAMPEAAAPAMPVSSLPVESMGTPPLPGEPSVARPLPPAQVEPTVPPPIETAATTAGDGTVVPAKPIPPETSTGTVESAKEPTTIPPTEAAAEPLPAPTSPASQSAGGSTGLATPATSESPVAATVNVPPIVPPIEAATPASEMQVSFNLTICDFAGKPIAGLKYKVVAGKENHSGTTNDQGQIAEISGLVPNQPLEFFVTKSDGTYSSKYEGLVACGNMNMCAVSPHIKIALETEPHKGPAGPPVTKPPKPPVIAAPVAPIAGGIVGNGKQPAITPVACRNDAGHPAMSLKEKTADWAKRNHIPTLGLWSWDDFKPKATGCTVPAVTPPPQVPAPTATQKPSVAAAQKQPASAPAVAKPAPVTVGQDKGPVTVTSANQSVPAKVTRLIAIMEEQSLWEWKKMFEKPNSLSSAEVKAKILNGTFVPITGKEQKHPDGRCYPSVKVGLWRAELATGYGVDIPAKGAGPWLLQQGFHDVTQSIPDARWALPGDVIVYRYSDAYEKANTDKHAVALAAYVVKKKQYDAAAAELPEKLHLWKEEEEEAARRTAEAKKNKQKIQKAGKHPKPVLGAAPSVPDDENWGHIDVRTYDGYISDFKSIRLPDLLSKKPMVVLGVYRKVFDPMPDLRVRAFLKVLREWECHGHEDKDRYFRLQNPIDGKYTFSDTSTHPRKSIGGNGTFAGAYQIALGTYNGQVDKGLPSNFTPANQDRLAVGIIEGRAGNPLGKIRQGDIEGAVKALSSEWSSLPGGVDCRHEMRAKKNYSYTMADLVERYNTFLNELIGK